MQFNTSKKVRLAQSEESLKRLENTTQDVLGRIYGDNNIDTDKSNSGSLSFSIKKDSALLQAKANLIIKPNLNSEGYVLDADATMTIPTTFWIVVGIIAIIGLFAFFIPGLIIIGVACGLIFGQKNKFTKGLEEALNKISKEVQ